MIHFSLPRRLWHTERGMFARPVMRFSSRLEWDRPPNRLARRLGELKAAGTPILDLTESNPTRCNLDYDAVQILGPLAAPQSLRYCPDPAGLREAREAVASLYARRGRQVHPDQIVLASSTSEAYSYLFKLLADPGDEVLAPRPSYPLFGLLADLDGLVLRHYDLRYTDGWWLDFESLELAYTERSRALLVVDPNNPAGCYVKPHEWDRLHTFCGRRGLPLIVDEVFHDYSLSNHVNLDVIYDNRSVFLLNGLSKLAGLPQMKLAWIVIHGPAEDCRHIRHRLELIADTYLSVSTPAQLAASAWLESSASFQARLLERLRRNRNHIDGAVAGTHCRALVTEGGWSAVLRLPAIRTDEEWALLFLEHDQLLVQPGFFFDFDQEALVVISLLVEPAVFDEGVRRLVRRADTTET